MTTASSDQVRRTLFLLLGVGLAVRVAFITFHQQPVFSDQADYHSLAVTLVEEFRYANAGQATAYRPVGYPFVLALAYGSLGTDPLVARLLQGLIDSLTALLLFLVGLRVSRMVAILAGTFWLFFPPAILYSNLLLAESITVFLLVLGCYIVTEAVRTLQSWKFLLLGVTVATLILMKPWIVVFCILLVVVLMRHRVPIFKIVLFAATLLLFVLPWLIRNEVVLGSFSLSTNTGMNLYIGNNPEATGAYNADFPNELIETNETGRNQRALSLAIGYIAKYPDRFVANGIKKLAHLFRSEAEVLIWSFFSDPTDQTTRFSEKYRLVPISLVILVNGAYVLALILGAVGFFSSKMDVIAQYALSLFVTTLLVHFVFFGGSRFHFVFIPFFVFYAAVAVSIGPRGWSQLSSGKKMAFAMFASLASAVWIYEFILFF